MTRVKRRLAEAYEAALAHEKAGRVEQAIAGWRAVLALDPSDHGGAAVRLAALGAEAAPEQAPGAYVRTLFDQHAEAFDEILVERLGYRVPWRMRRMLEDNGGGPPQRLLDLGCGTGLVGQVFSDIAGHSTGVDLSEGMLEVAADRAVYDDLYLADAVAFLEAAGEDEDEPWDLVTAADVLPYLGTLAPLFEAVAANLSPHGLWLFSTETLEGGPDYVVCPRHRFAHAEAYVERSLAAAGFAPVAAEPITIRHEQGEPVPGQLVLARRN